MTTYPIQNEVSVLRLATECGLLDRPVREVEAMTASEALRAKSRPPRAADARASKDGIMVGECRVTYAGFDEHYPEHPWEVAYPSSCGGFNLSRCQTFRKCLRFIAEHDYYVALERRAGL